MPYLAVALIAIVLLLILDHGDEVLWLNAHRHPVFDVFNKYWTFFGDGWIFAVVFLALITTRWRHAVSLVVLGAVQLIVSAVLKRVIFKEVPRPKVFFAGKEPLVFIEGVRVHGHFSFPSGHTMTAFAIATFLALIIDDRRWSLLLLIMATLVAVSRIYLLQHFLVDVTAGSSIGIMLSMSVYMFLQQFMEKDLAQ